MCTLIDCKAHHFNSASFAAPEDIWKILDDGYFDVVGQHNPHLTKITCFDARMTGKMTTYRVGEVFNPRTPGATLPKDLSSYGELEEGFCISDLKKVRQFLIAPHSSCLAANTALKYPVWSLVPGDHPSRNNMRRIVVGLERVGVDLVELSEESWDLGRDKVVKNLSRGEQTSDAMIEAEATNLMAKELCVASGRNFENYKILDDMTGTVQEAIKAGKASLTVVFINLEKKRFEVFDKDTGEFRWKDKAAQHLAETCPTLEDIGFTIPHHRHGGRSRNLAFDN